jgi:hypothetical protein
MNGLRNFFGLTINSVATVYSIVRGADVSEPCLVIITGAGGYGATRFARSISQERAQAAVDGIGLLSAALLFWQQTQG